MKYIPRKLMRMADYMIKHGKWLLLTGVSGVRIATLQLLSFNLNLVILTPIFPSKSRSSFLPHIFVAFYL
jgi:hypothetical protein